MRVAYCNILLNRNPMEAISLTVPVYEVNVLKAAHGDDKVSYIDESISVQARDDMDSASEFARLKKVFGNHPDTRVPFADLVFGRDGAKAIVRENEAALAEYDQKNGHAKPKRAQESRESVLTASA